MGVMGEEREQWHTPRQTGKDKRLSNEQAARQQKVPACRFSSRRRLSHAYPPKDGPQGEVIGHFECPGQDEGPSNDEQGTL